jgi:hypothetical protein
VHRNGRRLCRKITYLFNPYFCVNKLEKQKCGKFFTFPRIINRFTRNNVLAAIRLHLQGCISRTSPFVFPFSNRCIRFYLRGLWAEQPRFDYRQEQHIVLYCTGSRPALGPTQPPIQWVPVAFSPRVKRPGSGADHSHPSSAEVKNDEAVPPHPMRLHCVLLVVRFTFLYTDKIRGFGSDWGVGQGCNGA